jgi:hypothetical protein
VSVDTTVVHETMRQISRFAVTLIVAVLLLTLADRIFQPVPIPAGTAALGGLLALWVRSEWRAVWAAGGLVIGATMGTGIHLLVHLTGRSTLSDAGVLAHVSTNGIGGLAVGTAVFLPVALVAWLLGPRLSGILAGSSESR